MGRVRKPLQMVREGNQFVVRFRHPLQDRVVRATLGDAHVAEGNLAKLNAIFLHPDVWRHPPDGTPKCVLDAWVGPAAGVTVKVEDEARVVRVNGRVLRPTADEVARLAADNQRLEREVARLNTENRKLRRELEHWLSKKLNAGPLPALSVALATWVNNFKNKDDDHTKIVTYDLERFVKKFAGATTLDDMAGREAEIKTWLDSLTIEHGGRKGRRISSGRYAQLRRHVLRFLEESGLRIDRKAIPAPTRAEVRKDRGAIRWLEREQAEAVAKALPEPWCDAFRVQVGTGLRPNELPTLKRADFTDDFSTMSLSEFQHLTLKNGSRTIKVPVSVRSIIKRRLEDCDMVFPDPSTGEVWLDIKRFDKQYRVALRKAGTAAKVKFKLDCRTGRRTCGSLLLRAGSSVDSVAAILGDTPETIREHYAAILPHEVDPSAAALKCDTGNLADTVVEPTARPQKAS